MLVFGFIKIETEGTLDSNARIYVSNYVSYLDPFMYFSLFPFTYLKFNHNSTKNFSAHLFSSIFHTKVVKTSSEKVSRLCCDPYYLNFLVFPEEEPGNGTAIVKFNADAFSTEYVVQPCVIRYSLAFIPETFNSLYNNGTDLFHFFFNILCIPFIKVKISFLDTVVRKGDSAESVQLAEMTQLKMASVIGTLAISEKYS